MIKLWILLTRCDFWFTLRLGGNLGLLSINSFASEQYKNFNYWEKYLEFKTHKAINLILWYYFDKQFFNDVKINLKQKISFQIFLMIVINNIK